MKEYKRTYPFYALCGLNCGLCPRYHTDGDSKCPGCGGPDFHLKHPSCTVITCNKKHDNVEFCFQCSLYPCKKYKKPNKTDSFITYKNVLIDFTNAKKDLSYYKKILNEKMKILNLLIDQYNDGKRKNYYCIAVNLLSIEDLKTIMKQIKTKIDKKDISIKDKITLIINLINEFSKNNGIELELRK
jgi:hypothetical protein